MTNFAEKKIAMKAIVNKSKPNPTILETAGPGAMPLEEFGILLEQKICEAYKTKRASTDDTGREGDEPVRIPGLPYTLQERVDAIHRAEADYQAGLFATSDELRAKHPRI